MTSAPWPFLPRSCSMISGFLQPPPDITKRPFEVAGTLLWNAQGCPTQDDFSSICARVISCMTNTRFCRVFITRRFFGLDHPSSVGRRSLANVGDNGQLCAQEKKHEHQIKESLPKKYWIKSLGVNIIFSGSSESRFHSPNTN